MTASADPYSNDLMAARCARTCKRGQCTGTGSTRPYAHQCQFFPPPAAPVCSILGCLDESAGRIVSGERCAMHLPAQPEHRPSPHPSPSADRTPPVYGTATTDPLGRDGPGWHIGKQSGLPTRDQS